MDRKEIQFNSLLQQDDQGRTIIYPKNGKSGYVVSSNEQLIDAKKAFFQMLSNPMSFKSFYSKIDEIFKDAEIYNQPLNRFLAFDKQALGYSYWQITYYTLGSLLFVAGGCYMAIQAPASTYRGISVPLIGFMSIGFFGLCLVASFLILARKIYLSRQN